MQVHGERRSKRYRGSDRKVEISGSREPNVPAIRPPITLRGASNLQESMRRAGQLARSDELRCLNLRRRAGPRNFSCERRKGFSGQKPHAGRQPGYRQAAPRTDNTPRVSCVGLSATKAAGGGSAKSFLRCGVRDPGGGGSPRGARVAQGLHRLCANTALAAGSKALKSAGGVAGAGQTAGDFV